MIRLKFTIDYNGTGYSGWQKQPNEITVQGCLEDAIDKLLSLDNSIVGCGRTDSGVHGRGYVFHADVLRSHEQVVYKLNRILPNDIKICTVEEVNTDFHARFNALSREYEYFISFQKDVFNALSFHYQYEPTLDISKLNSLANSISRTKSFQYFKKEHGSSKTDYCDIFTAKWEIVDRNTFKFIIRGSRFLRGMVRLLVGAQLNCHREAVSVDDFSKALEGEKPITQPWSVPANGLFFTGVEY